MVRPIRIAGLEDYTGALDFDSPPLGGLQVSYTSPHGEVWGLHYPTVKESEVQRVVLKESGLEGATAQLEETTVESVNQFGSRMAGFTLPAFDVTSEVVITSDVLPLDKQEREWRASWSAFKPGKMTVVARDGANRWTPARLVSMPDVPYELRRRRYWETSVTWKLVSGCWFGATQRYFDTVTIFPAGDVAPRLRLRWDGSATSVTFPTGLTVNLPAISGTRFINLDWGFSGQVTREDGTVDSAVWSALRGIVVGLTLAPYEPAAFVLGDGLSLEVTPRYLSPWR